MQCVFCQNSVSQRTAEGGSMKGFQNLDFFVNETYENAFSAVPDGKKKPTNRLIFILAGFAFSTSGLTVGTRIGSQMTFLNAVGVCLAGNLLLFLIALFWGMQGYRSGYTSVFLVKSIFGDRTASLFSILIVFSVILWIGMNGDLLARVLLSIFEEWPLPVSMTALIMVALGIIGPTKGWRNLEVMSRIMVPAIIAMTVYNIIWLIRAEGNVFFLIDYRPQTALALPAAFTMIVGNFLLSATTMPDICRFAKSRGAVISCVSVYALVMMVSNLCGILIVQSTGANSLNYGIYLLGMIVPSAIWIVLCGYTTQNMNLYTGSLAIQNFVRETVMEGNISHKVAVLFIGGLSGIAGIIGTARFLPEITNLQIAVLLPLTGIAVAEMSRFRKYGKVKGSIPVAAWSAGVIVAFSLWGMGIKQIFILPAVISCILYVWLRVHSDRKK